MKNWYWILILIFVSLVVGYFSNQKGFETGRDFTAQMDSTNPKKWTNNKWGYEITFPGEWDSIKRDDPSVTSTGADVFCSSKSGASTAVFISPIIPNQTINSAMDEILENYKQLGIIGGIEVLSKRDYSKDGLIYGIMIFKQKEYTHHYAIIFTNKIMLMISSNAPNELFTASKQDFESIVDSLKFF
ncbi:MAG: hypothetical protein NTZ92_01035 [Candidatus Omnitrophica bacterium]|nr:hypothetical protein [Candidatus Omnitrophota bacterium]